ncbi:MAG: hypothetical protein OJI67_21240 [Prosthecobacter sp.]|nr:hypothetical protein [Prosthecobacter sp.]
MKNLFALLLFAVGFGSLYLYWQHGKSKTDMAGINQNLASFEQAVTLKRTEFQALVNAVQAQKDIQEKLVSINKIKVQEDELKKQYAKLVSEKAEIILGIRKKVVGTTVPELILADGKKLIQVNILKADDSGLSISHSTGAQKIAPSDLNAEWRQKLYYLE